MPHSLIITFGSMMILRTVLGMVFGIGWEGRPSPAVDAAIANAIATADRIMAKIDARWPTPKPTTPS